MSDASPFYRNTWTNDPNPRRCSGSTKQGKRCGNLCKLNSDYCRVHTTKKVEGKP